MITYQLDRRQLQTMNVPSAMLRSDAICAALSALQIMMASNSECIRTMFFLFIPYYAEATMTGAT
jgi:hypothetical protein